jgi:hypothetical protein
MQSTIEWIDWNEREPFEGEALLVIFRHTRTGICHLQISSIITGPYWYDYEPVCGNGTKSEKKRKGAG